MDSGMLLLFKKDGEVWKCLKIWAARWWYFRIIECGRDGSGVIGVI